jgi:hypothetical protein
MPNVGDIFKNKLDDRLATVIIIGALSGVIFLQRADGSKLGITLSMLNERWELQ